MVYGYAFDGKLRFSVARTKSLVEEARLRHNLSPIVTVALGRLLTGASLTTPWLAETEVITFAIESNGPIGRIVAQARNFTVRGYVSNPVVETVIKDRKFDLSSVIGGGSLDIVRDLGLKTPYTSQVPLQTGEIAEDIAYYYAKSEQLPTAISLGVKIGKAGVIQAGGFALQ
ncbi:MAG: Hsp33 family molecular chaperone HslO, partial [Thermotogaceae bacterium]|nr:Hsp33 family molecular chaperone HslO [Thermotogaceae bacterium]